MPDGRQADWRLTPARVWPGLIALRAPGNPRYDVDGGPSLPEVGAREALERLLDGGTLPAGPRVIVASAVTAEGPAWEAIAALARDGSIGLCVVNAWERALLDRAAAPDAESYLRAFMSAGQRKRLRQKRKSLEAEAGPLSLALVERGPELRRALAVFCDLEDAGWKGRNGSSLVRDPPGLAYVEGVLQERAAAGAAFAAVLSAGDAPVAAGLFLRAGGEVLFWKTAYDERHARHSPGVLFDLALTEWLYAQPWFERLDAGHDDSVDPASLIWKQRRKMADVVIDLAPGSLRGRIVLTGQRLRLLLRNLKRRYAK